MRKHMVFASIAASVLVLGVVLALRPLSGKLGAVVLGEVSARGWSTVARLALALGADPNRSIDDRGPPLFRAAANGRVDVASLLLAHGANAKAVNALGRSALHAALSYRGSAAVPLARMMIQNGALEVERRGGNPVVAIGWGPAGPALVHLLRDSGIAPDEPLADGTRPVHFFIGERAPSIVDTLLEIGADAEGVDSHGKTPLQRAVALGYDDVVEVLLRRGAKVADRRVLEQAAEEGHAKAAATNQSSMISSYDHIREMLRGP